MTEMNKVYFYRIYTHPNDMPDDSLYSRVYMVVLEDLESEVLRLTDNGHTIIKVELAGM
jgi:hypothetical protein